MIDKVLVAKFDILELNRTREFWQDLRHFLDKTKQTKKRTNSRKLLKGDFYSNSIVCLSWAFQITIADGKTTHSCIFFISILF